MNAPNRYELYVLDEEERPVEVVEDTKIPNAATIKIVKQDHTLGNLLRAQLLAMPQVLFAGYKVPHPLQPYFLIKLQTDGSITPTALLEQACTKLIGTISTLESTFKKEFQMSGIGMGPTAGATAGGFGGPGFGGSGSAGWGSGGGAAGWGGGAAAGWGAGAAGGSGAGEDPYGTGAASSSNFQGGRDYLDI
ncbi:hypothetical protein QCA50_015491 [Cerrena zonata]|uniref:DNA-directed RNA polymerase RBP11-like dimerisation domain-containing protein n=1 Tax=Cerrena zonata TaxID=2478898 RepID=A0AAW0FT32_9APHY